MLNCKIKKISIHVSFLSTGYGFVDFDSPTAAEVAVQALQSQGIQAQMAKVQFEFESLVILTNHNQAYKMI